MDKTQPWKDEPVEIKGSVPVSDKDIDPVVMRELRKYPQLLESLDKWILFSERHLIRDMQALAAIVRKLKPLPDTQVLYRGFGNWSGQETMGFKTSQVKVGDEGEVRATDRAISFSTNVNIARSFGKILVVSRDWNKASCLYICPELCALVAERRNLPEIETQEEVIVLPPIDISCEVIEVRRNNWFGW